jgi:hypothetical protein
MRLFATDCTEHAVGQRSALANSDDTSPAKIGQVEGRCTVA